jgi:hypothetical protein
MLGKVTLALAKGHIVWVGILLHSVELKVSIARPLLLYEVSRNMT